MAYSTQRAVSDGTLINLNVSIGYLKQADIQVFYDGLPADDATWAWVGSTNVINFTPAVPDGVEVLLKRTTKIDGVINLFTSGASFTNAALDTNAKQQLYLNQEAVEGAALTDVFSDVDFHGYRIRNLGIAELPGDAVPLAQYQEDVGQYVDDATAQAVIATTQAGLASGFADDAEVSALAAAASAASAAATVGPAIVAAPTKATPIDADSVPLVDTADSNALKRVTWANVKATLKTYFDTLYAAAASVVLPATANPLADGSVAVGTSVKYAREDHVHPAAAAGIQLVQLSPQALTSDTFKDFTIPSGAKIIDVVWSKASTNGSSSYIVQLNGETSGYLSRGAGVGGTGDVFPSGMPAYPFPNSGVQVGGSLHLCLQSSATRTWVGTGLAVNNGSSQNGTTMASEKSLAADLTTLRFTTVNGTDVWDAGSVSVWVWY